MRREWNGQRQKCGKKTDCYIMSMFNERLICMDCCEKEEQRKDYGKARQADVNAIKQVNYNFKGIGLR